MRICATGAAASVSSNREAVVLLLRAGFGAAVVVASVVAAGCTASTHGSLPMSSSVSSPSGSSHQAGRSLQSPPRHRSVPVRKVAFLPAVAGRRVYVFVGPLGVVGKLQLRVSRFGGSRFVNIGPELPRDNYADSVFVLDSRHLWFTTFNGGGGRERLYRTDDGGKSWHWSPAPSHSMAGGSTDALWFIDPLHGWLTDIQPTAPNAGLYRTIDGGRHWQLFADTATDQAPNTLPTLGPVEYEPTGTTAWLPVAAFYHPSGLYVSRDAGQHWRTSLTAPRRSFTTPGVFGTLALEPASWCSPKMTRLQMYRSTDDGNRWTRQPAIDIGPTPRSPYGKDCQPVATAVPTARAAWAAAIADGHVVVQRSCDQVRHWHTAHVPTIRADLSPQIEATDCRHALLAARGAHGITQIYTTSDGGNSWRRIDRLATR